MHLFLVFTLSGRSVDQKLQIAGLAQYSLAPGGKPYKIAAYIPGSKVNAVTGSSF